MQQNGMNEKWNVQLVFKLLEVSKFFKIIPEIVPKYSSKIVPKIVQAVKG